MVIKLPELLWHELHGVQNQSAEASLVAYQVVQESPEWFLAAAPDEARHQLLNLVRISAMAGKTAARQAKNEADKRRHLWRVFQTIVGYYPFAGSQEKTKARQEAWQGVYGEQDPVLICLRDMLHLSQYLASDTSLPAAGWVAAVSHALVERCQLHPTDPFALIALTEQADLAEARQAFTAYWQLVRAQPELYQPRQVVTVTTRMWRRLCLEVGPTDKDVNYCLGILSYVSTNNRELAPYISKEVSNMIGEVNSKQVPEKLLIDPAEPLGQMFRDLTKLTLL